MKGKRVKRAHRFMQSVYERAFGLRRPFQLILDAHFLNICLKNKIYFKDALPEILGGPVRLFTTACVVGELQREQSAAVFNARRLELRRCPHTGQNMSGSECIGDIIGSNNKHNYGVCAQEEELRSALRKIAGVPLLFVNRGILLLEPPSETTLLKARELQQGRQVVEPREMSAIMKIAPAPTDPNSSGNKKKARKQRGVNPLSCKRPSTAKERHLKRPRKHRSKLIK